MNNYLLKDSFNPFLHPSQVKESDSSSSSDRPSVKPSRPAQPPGSAGCGRNTVTAGPSPPKDSDNTESLDGDNTEDEIIRLNFLVLKAGLTISRVQL